MLKSCFGFPWYQCISSGVQKNHTPFISSTRQSTEGQWRHPVLGLKSRFIVTAPRQYRCKLSPLNRMWLSRAKCVCACSLVEICHAGCK